MIHHAFSPLLGGPGSIKCGCPLRPWEGPEANLVQAATSRWAAGHLLSVSAAVTEGLFHTKHCANKG